MGFLQVYAHVLGKLGPDNSLGWLLALANVAVTVALFAEPVLFGSVINVLTVAQADAASAVQMGEPMALKTNILTVLQFDCGLGQVANIVMATVPVAIGPEPGVKAQTLDADHAS